MAAHGVAVHCDNDYVFYLELTLISLTYVFTYSRSTFDLNIIECLTLPKFTIEFFQVI